jgi:hypothetical protein
VPGYLLCVLQATLVSAYPQRHLETVRKPIQGGETDGQR